MRFVFSRIFFILICGHFSTSWSALDLLDSKGSVGKSPLTTASSVDIGSDISLGEKVANIRTTLCKWVVDNKIPLDKLFLLDRKGTFDNLKKSLREATLPELFVDLNLPTPPENVIEVLQQWCSLPAVPFFTSLIDGCLSLVNKDTREEAVLRSLGRFRYK